MVAAQLIEPGKLMITKTPDPSCPDGGVIVEVRGCGICASDARMVEHGHPALVYPRILGHEIAGIVVESRTSSFLPGARVQVAPGLRCTACSQCRRGADNRCRDREIFGFTRDGGFARYLPVPLAGTLVGHLTPLPDSLGFEEATLGEPLACCINAQEKIGISAEDSVLVFGAGTLGLLHLLLAKSRMTKTVIVADPLASRRDAALRFGADFALAPLDADFSGKIMEITGQTGVDALIFATSRTGLDEAATRLLAPGGRVSLFSGGAPAAAGRGFDPDLIHYREIMLSGAYGCTARQNEAAIGMLSAKRARFSELLTRRITLRETAQGIALTKNNVGFKVALTDFE